MSTDWLAAGFDPTHPAYKADPFGTYRRLLAEMPAHRNARGMWVISRHRDAAMLLADTKRVMKKPEIALKQFRPGPFREHNRHVMNIMDPPDHGRVRGTVARYFTPRALAALTPAIEAYAREMLDALGERFDLMSDYAQPFPIAVICEMLGVPSSERARFKRWSHAIVTGLEQGATLAAIEAAEAASVEFAAFFADLAEHRRRHPGDDVLSVMVRHQDEDRLLPLELVHNAAFLLNAGHETTTNLIGNAVAALLDDEAARRKLTAEPALMESAVEEFLRFDPPLHFAFRRTAEPIEIEGARIEANAPLLIGFAAANRDPAVFAEPDRLDLARKPNPHLAFAPGVHFCLGATLARIEGRIALTELLRRFPDFRADGAPERNAGRMFQGFSRLPLRRG